MCWIVVQSCRISAGSSTSSVPGARWGSHGWVNPDGDLFLFGGFGYGSNATVPTGFLNDEIHKFYTFEV